MNGTEFAKSTFLAAQTKLLFITPKKIYFANDLALSPLISVRYAHMQTFT